jgi:hypothetical protein
MYKENAGKLILRIKEADSIHRELLPIFENVNMVNKHIEYVYLNHFLRESLNVSYLFQSLFSDENTKIFLPVANRMLFEILMHTEHILRLNKEGDNILLSFLSKDMASIMSALDDAVGSSDNNPASETLLKLGIANKLQKTDFDLDKIKPNTPTFPNIKNLCEKSQFCIKDYCGSKLYHYYVQWSWNNHSRLGNTFVLEKNSDKLLNNHVECFVEIYLKNLKYLSQHAGADEQAERALVVMKEIGIQVT